jgi:hypothetical protein
MKGVCVADLLDRMQEEIGERLGELKPLVEESERLEVAAAALGEMTGSAPIVRTQTASTPPAAEAAPVRAPQRAKRRRKAASPKPKRASLSSNQRAIVAALEHGAHTVRELVVVTGMSDQTVRNNVKGLVGLEKVVKVERGGKVAYALAGSGKGTGAG